MGWSWLIAPAVSFDSLKYSVRVYYTACQIKKLEQISARIFTGRIVDDDFLFKKPEPFLF